MEELRPLTFRLRYYPVILASLVSLMAMGVVMPAPDPLLREVYAQYIKQVKELESMLSNATLRDQVVYKLFVSSASSVLVSATPIMGPFFATYTLTSAGVGMKALAAVRSISPLNSLIAALLDPSLWILLLAYTIALVESAYLTQAILRKNRPALELTLAMLALAIGLTLLSATLFVALATLSS